MSGKRPMCMVCWNGNYPRWERAWHDRRLTMRDRAITLARRDGRTLQSIADEWGMTRERVRQIAARGEAVDACLRGKMYSPTRRQLLLGNLRSRPGPYAGYFVTRVSA